MTTAHTSSLNVRPNITLPWIVAIHSTIRKLWIGLKMEEALWLGIVFSQFSLREFYAMEANSLDLVSNSPNVNIIAEYDVSAIIAGEPIHDRGCLAGF